MNQCSAAAPAFVQVSLNLLAALPARAAALYARLKLHSNGKGYCFVKQATLAREIGLKSANSRRQIIRLLQILEDAGLIRCERERRFNTYHVLPVGAGADVTKMSHLRCDKNVTSHSHKRSIIKRSIYTPSRENGSGASEANGNSSSFVADDEKNLTPEQEFERRVTARHGTAITAADLRDKIHAELSKNSRLTFVDFLAYDAQKTTGNRFNNPAGYYIHLARELARETAKRLRAELRRSSPGTTPVPAEVERDDRGRCTACGGPGILADGGFCRCPIGNDLARLHARKNGHDRAGSAIPRKPPRPAG